MGIASLPAELLEHIISLLVTSDNRAVIHSCALVHSTWLPPCRRILFANITIYDAVWRLKRAHAILKGRPELAEFVRSVTWDLWDQGQHYANPSPTLAISVMKRLHAVRSLTLQYHTQGASGVAYKGFGHLVRYAPVVNITELNLRSAVFASDAQFCGFIAHFPQLEVLLVHDISWLSTSADLPLILHCPRLKRLDVGGAPERGLHTLLDWLLAAHQVPRLQYLSVDLRENMQSFNTLLALIGDVLETIIINGNHVQAPLARDMVLCPPSLHAAHHLQQLELLFVSPSIVANVVETLSSPGFRTLSALTFGSVDDTAWARVRDALRAFHAVEKVTLSTTRESYQELQAWFPELMDRGVLQLP